MQINITNKEGPLAKISRKLTIVFLGIFITASIFSIMTKLLQGSYGIIAGLIICGTLIFCGFYYVKKGTKLRLLTWSILITIITILMIVFIGLSFVSNNLDFQPTT